MTPMGPPLCKRTNEPGIKKVDATARLTTINLLGENESRLFMCVASPMERISYERCT